MPGPVSSLSSARSAGKSGNVRQQTSVHSNKTRVVRRRGRAKDIPESDDEIEREAGTDSESDTDQSSSDPGSESGPEPVHDKVSLLNGHSPPSTPSATHLQEDAVSKEARLSPEPVINGNDGPSFFSNPSTWSEMVAEENANGPADLPVIDFEDFDRHGLDQPLQTTSPPRKAHKPSKKVNIAKSTLKTAQNSNSSAPTSTKDDQEEQEPSEQSIASSSRQVINGKYPKRPIGQTARQAYQHRLESDPSYVPTVGEFWGHDDRLLDKDLRSLSGWWRGRWQGHGRGRGGFDRGFAMRGRGRGGHVGHRAPATSDQQPSGDQQRPRETSKAPPEMAPIEQAWTHDGFEEMRRKDEQRRAQEQPAVQPLRGLGSFRGRGGIGRGRGAFHRGGSVTSPSSRLPVGLPSSQPNERHWFTTKPERTWTKQHDAFLHFDPSFKPRNGQRPTYRIKLTANEPRIVRASAAPAPAPAPVPVPVPPSQPPAVATREGTPTSEDGEKTFVVRLPPRVGGERAMKTAPEEESISTAAEPPIDDIFVVKPGRAERILSAPAMITSMVQSNSAVSNSLPDGKVSQSSPPVPLVGSAEPGLEALQGSPEPTDLQSTSSPQWIQAEVTVMKHTSPEAQAQQEEPAQPRPSHTVLPPLQTAFTPIPRGSPSFGSPYAYGPALPPGIGMNQHGVPYELATGRAVYLQPPQTVYNPRPVMHSHVAPFVPGHMHHHSTVSPTPEFLTQPPSHTPPINGFVDPSSGMPLFSLPRSSRIEIRAPTEQSDGKAPNRVSGRRPSGLRSNMAGFEPTNNSDDTASPRYVVDNAYSTPDIHRPEDMPVASSQSGADGVMYSFYPHQYYYPEAYSYPPYLDVPQVASYEMYSSDPRAGQSTVYY